MEDMHRKPVLAERNMLHQQAMSPYKDFSKGTPKMRDTQPFTTNKGLVTQIQE